MPENWYNSEHFDILLIGVACSLFAPGLGIRYNNVRITGMCKKQHERGVATTMVEMTIESVRINLATQQRVVILKATSQDRYLLIWIAHPEAYAIAVELQGTTAQRPLTHDLLKNVISSLGARLVSVVISDLVEEVYYARLVLDIDGRHVEVDSRPSDAIALAVRAKAPIYVEDDILERSGVKLEQAEDPEPPSLSAEDEEKVSAQISDVEDENLDAYRDFINTLDALDDFGKE